MAELLVHKDNFEGAAKHLEDVLIKKPGWKHLTVQHP